MNAKEIEKFLTGEIDALEGTVQYAYANGLTRIASYSQGVVEAYTLARAAIRTGLCPELVAPGDVLQPRHHGGGAYGGLNVWYHTYYGISTCFLCHTFQTFSTKDFLLEYYFVDF